MTRIWTLRLGLLLAMSISAAAQDASPGQTTGNGSNAGTGNDQSQPSTSPAPAFGQNAPVLDPENPPVTGLDVPSLNLRGASRSFIAPALQVSESGDSNGANELGESGAESVTRVLGSLDLQKFWAKSDLYLEYLGGGEFYSNPFEARQLQAVGIEGVTRWRTGQITVRDSFSYLADGSFQIGYGGDPGLGLLSGGLGTTGAAGLRSGNSLGGAVGNIPVLSNSAIVDVVQALTPRSAITVAGGFSNAHFYDDVPPPDTLVNSDQVTVQGGYSHLISRRDQLGIIYAFQLYQFPQTTGGEIYTQILNVRWSHTITGRLSLIVGVGPQRNDIESQGSGTIYWSPNARGELRYKLGRGSLYGSYEKYTSSGSGFFAGAGTQDVRVGYTRPVGRTWEFFGDAGYSHNKRLQGSCAQNDSLCTLGAYPATSYNDESAGIVMRKHLGRSYDFFGAYRFAELSFSTPGSAAVCIGGSCGRTAQRNIGTIGVEWHPKPTRIE